MAYLHTTYTSSESFSYGFDAPYIENMPDVSRTFVLKESDRDAVLEFLNRRPVHTVAMTSFIYDNGIESPLNRGSFYGYHDRCGNLEGVALIGHTTLVEARSKEALQALAFAAKTSGSRMHMIMCEGDLAFDFWADAVDAFDAPKMICREYLFEIGFPFHVQDCKYELRLANESELEKIAEAHAEVAFMETGVDPLLADRNGFLDRVLRRIKQGRIYVVVENGELVFKADVTALTTEVAYLEGIYVNSNRRGEGIAPNCLAEVGRRLLEQVRHVCLLSNSEYSNAHRSFQKAGFRYSGECTTVFV